MEIFYLYICNLLTINKISMPLIIFTELDHSYVAEGKKWDSVNKVKDYFLPDFDTEYWSFYKAIEFLVPDFAEKKSKLRYPQIRKPNMSWLYEVSQNFSKAQIEDAVKLINQKWDDSRTNGTYFHQKQEAKILEAGFFEWQGKKYKVHNPEKEFDNQSICDDLSQLEPGCYMEIIIFYKIGFSYFLGTADILLITEDRKITIIDYKTNEKFSTAKGDKCAKPFDHIDSGKLTGYSLQLSFYGYLMSLWGYEVEGLHIFHYKDYDEEKRKIYDCVYYEEEIKMMIKIYREQVYGEFDI